MDILANINKVKWSKDFMIGWNCTIRSIVFYFKDKYKWFDFITKEEKNLKNVMSIQVWELVEIK